MNVRDLHWVEFPAGAGRAQAGRRPAIQGTAANDQLPTVLMIPLTTQQDALRFPGTVFVESDSGNGLSRASVAVVFQLTVVDQRFVKTQLGTISEAVMEAIWAAFDEITDRQN